MVRSVYGSARRPYEVVAGIVNRSGRGPWNHGLFTSWSIASRKLDDPSFPAPIFAIVIEVDGEEGFSRSRSMNVRYGIRGLSGPQTMAGIGGAGSILNATLV